MRTILRFMMAMLVPLSIGTSVSARNPHRTKTEYTEHFKDSIMAKKNTYNFSDGELFLINVKNDFWAEKIGLEPTTGQNAKYDALLKQIAADSTYTATWGDNSTAEFVYDKLVSSVYNLPWINTDKAQHAIPNSGSSADTYDGTMGKLYGFTAGEINRFMFVERDKSNAYNGTSSDTYYSPFKYNAGTGLYNDSNDKGYREWSPQQKNYSESAQYASGQAYGTEYWLDALGQANLFDKLSQELLAKTSTSVKYGYIPFTHDCKNAVMRAHFIYINKPTIWNNGKLGGSYIKKKKSYHYTNVTVQAVLHEGESSRSKSDVTSDKPYVYDFSPNYGSPNTADGHSGTPDTCPICSGTGTGHETQTLPAGTINKLSYYTSYTILWRTIYNEHDADYPYSAMEYENYYGDVTATVPSGTYSPYVFSASAGQGVKNPMVLVYIPSRADVTSFYRDNNNLWNKYVPYMQLYQADWIDASCKGEEVEGTNNYKHQLDWFTSVDDKLERKAANQIFKIEYVRSDDPTQTKRVLPGYGETDKYWKGKEIKDESGQVTGTEDEPFTELWTREDYTYTVTYYVTCIIPGLEGLQVEISRPLDVPGKKQQLHLSVSAYSTPHDSQSAWDTDGYNTIKHTLTITRDRSMKTGWFQVKRQQSEGGAWANEGERFQVLDEGNTFTGTFTREVTFDQRYNNHTKYDNYKVVYTPGEGEQVATSAQTSNEDKADFLTADFSVQVHGNEVLGVNNYLYSDQVKFTNITDEKGLVNNYSTRNGSSDRWNATYSRYENFTNPQENPIFVSTYPETRSGNQTYKYLGYLHTTNNGVWGVGPATTTHNPDITVSGEVTVDIYPHNQVIEVEMNPDSESETQTNPIWNYPGAKTKTKQIFPGVDFDIRADKLPRDIDGKTSYNVAFGLVLYVWEQVEEEVQGVETLVWKWNKHILNGEQYFNQIDNVGTPDSKGVYKPTFTPSGTIAMTGDSYTTQQNVIYDFKNKVCHYDAFAFYVNPTTGYVVAYAHSGFPKITSTVTYDSQEYREALDRVPYEEVEFENGVGEVEGTTYIKLDDGAIRADKFYQGNPSERYDGYAYIVLDLDKVIPTKDSHYKVGDSRSDDLRSAITSYKITATQKGNTPDASTGRKGLQLFYPTIGDEDKTIFNIANYDDGKKPAIDGLKPGLHWNTATTDELHIYADVTVNQTSGAITNVNLVEGVHPTGDEETTNRLESAGNNCVLIGLRYIDKMRKDGGIEIEPEKVTEGEGTTGSNQAPQKGDIKVPELVNGITLFIEPEYTFVQPEKPVFSFGDKYHSGVTPQYATDVPEVATIDEDGDDTTSDPTEGTTGSSTNSITEKFNPNREADRVLSYLAKKLIDAREEIAKNIGREKPHTFSMASVISGASSVKVDDNVKVFADGRDIVVEGAEGEVIVFNAYGQSVYAGHSSRIAMAQPGVYLVAANGSIYKVFVK